MSEQLIKMTAYCGLFCRDCIRFRSKIIDHARSLLLELEKRKFHRYAEVKMAFDNGLANYPIFIDVLKKIIELDCRQSCREGGGCSAFDCQILKCCREKQYEGCWECKQLADCDKFDFLQAFHGETPKNNCIDLRDNGFDDFVLRKKPFYVWHQE